MPRTRNSRKTQEALVKSMTQVFSAETIMEFAMKMEIKRLDEELEKLKKRREELLRGIICNECGNELPCHTVTEHLDVDCNIHKCPHKI